MPFLNIRASTDDPHYRYKMPALESKTTVKGKYGHTTLLNAADVATALHRDLEELLRFMAYELGVPHRKPTPGHAIILKGLFRTSDLQQVIFAYADKFVLCPNCHDPETTYALDLRSSNRGGGGGRGGAIRHFCRACHADAARTELVDPSHKLCKFILNRERAAQQKTKQKGIGGKKQDKKKNKSKDGKHGTNKSKKRNDADEAAGAAAVLAAPGGSGNMRLVHGGCSFGAFDPDAWAADFAAQRHGAVGMPSNRGDPGDEVWASEVSESSESSLPAAAEPAAVAAASNGAPVPAHHRIGGGSEPGAPHSELLGAGLLGAGGLPSRPVPDHVAASARLLEAAMDGGALVATAAALLQPRGKLSPSELCAALFRAVFGRCQTAAAAAAAFADSFRPALSVVGVASSSSSSSEAADESQGHLLAAIELHFAGVDCVLASSSSSSTVATTTTRTVRHPRLAFLPLVLHLCHEADLLSAETLQAWLAVGPEAAAAGGVDRGLLAAAKTKAEAFVSGLGDDDTESDSDSESDDSSSDSDSDE